MQGVIHHYRDFLLHEYRFHQEIVAKMLDGLSLMLRQMAINDLKDLDSGKVLAAWRRERWQVTDLGIEESVGSGYVALRALKAFLKFLEEQAIIEAIGLSEIIALQEVLAVPPRVLSENEIAQLRQFLVFHVDSDSKRKETALCFLMLSTGFTLEELCALTVHRDGNIKTGKPGQSSGHFRWYDNRAWVCSPQEGDDIPLPEEVLHFLNFYLENRRHLHFYAFLSNTRDRIPRRLVARSGEKILVKVLRNAGFPIRDISAETLLQQSAQVNQNRSLKNARQIISGHSTAQSIRHNQSHMMMHVA